MENKEWLWRKKSTEKTIFDTDNGNLHSKWKDEEVQILLSDKEELEKDLKNLSDHLTCALFELNAKDELVKKNAEMTQEAIASLKKAETVSISLKQELNEALHHNRTAGEERLSNLDAALKQCMHWLHSVRDDQEKTVHDARFLETSKRIAKMGVENSHLSEALLAKEQLIEDLNQQKSRVETDLSAVLAGLDSTERDNATLKYEVRVLEKELEIRNKEREYNRRAADATHKQHLESVKKIAELESECQRLRVLVRKRLPGPAALEKMRNEVEMLKSNSAETRKRRLIPSPTLASAAEQLRAMEEENQTLKEALNRTVNELQLSHARHARTAYKLESLLKESSKVQATVEPSRSSFMSQELSLASISDLDSDDNRGSCSESWACALISELEHFRSRKQQELQSSKASDINLMDDFLEMEKLATVPVDKPSMDLSGAVTDVDISQTGKSIEQVQSDMSESISKIIELIDGIGLPSEDGDSSWTGYIVRVFQWKVSEVVAVLQQYVQTCYCLLDGKADLSRFSQETASVLDWIINHCFSIQDVSSMRDEIQKQYGWDESRSEHAAESGVLKLDMSEENRKLKDELLNTVSAKEDVEGRLEAAICKNEFLLNQLKESEEKIASLETEILRVSKGKVEEQIENYKLMNEDLDAQLTASRSELTEVYQKFSSLEAELEGKTSCYEELEAMCVELQLQLESVTKKENLNHVTHEEEKQVQTSWEISAASEKLAECQEAILNLEKQIKALAAPKEATLFDKVISTPTKSTNSTTTTTMTLTPPSNKSLIRHSSLLDHMIAEDYERKTSLNVTRHQDIDTTVGARSIVSNKKQGHTCLWRKMIWRRKRGNGKKLSPPFPQR